MKNRIFVLLLLSVVLSTLSAAPSPAQIPLDSPIYQEMDSLFRLTGLPLPSASRPWNTKEAAQMLTMIPANGPYEELRSTIERRLGPADLTDQSFSWSIVPTINLEGYFHTNPTDFKTYHDWNRGYDERKPMVDLDFAFQYGSTVYFSTSAQVAIGAFSEKYDSSTPHPDPIGALFDGGEVILADPAYHYQKRLDFNLYTGSQNLEADFPRRSQLTAAGPWWAISLGRGARSWGHGQSGNLIIGSHISNHTSLSISFFNPKAKIELLYLFFTDFTSQSRNRMFLGHRIEFQPLKWARFTITENIMVLVNNLSPQFFDPTYIYHNVYDPPHANAIAALEGEFALMPGLSLHVQGALDQFQLPSETASTANAMALLANLTYGWQQKKGYWSTHAEFVLIDPAFYRRQDVDFLVARDVVKNQNHAPAVIIDYLGHRWGSDSLVYQIGAEYFIPELMAAYGSITIHRQGELTYTAHHNTEKDNKNEPNISGPPPYGKTVTDRLIVSLGGRWDTPLKGLSLYGQVDWIGRRIWTKATRSSSGESGDFQVTIGVSKRF